MGKYISNGQITGQNQIYMLSLRLFIFVQALLYMKKVDVIVFLFVCLEGEIDPASTIARK